MKKSITGWAVAVIILGVLSTIIPFLSIVTVLVFTIKLPYLNQLIRNIGDIDDAKKYCSEKRDEADKYYTERKDEADRMCQLEASHKRVLEEKIESLKKERDSLFKELGELEDESTVKSAGFDFDTSITSEEYKNKLSLLKVSETNLIKNDEAVEDIEEEHSERKAYNNFRKQILRCFNSECANIINATTVKNIDNQRSKLSRAYESINKIFETNGVAITPELLEYKFNELNLSFAYLLKKEQEKEEQKAIREQMLEEEKVRREIEREKQKIEKEETQFKNEISKLMSYLHKAEDIEKKLYLDKIHELEEKLKLLEKDKENVLDREQNTRAGFVYVISNIGSFGENIYKIGMTRRLEPMDRIKELGDASVPFEFDVHAMIFSEDAPALETILHTTFKDKQVNKVNPRKEFFNVNLSEIEKVVKENHNATVHFTEIAKAEQYRESLKIANNSQAV